MSRLTVKEQFINRKTIAVLPMCNFGGLEVIENDFNCDSQIVAAFNFGKGRTHIHVHNVHYSPSGRAYIWKLHRRYYLDEFMRV